MQFMTLCKYLGEIGQEIFPYNIVFFKYPLEIRNMIYTTNVIESLNSTIRKYTKTKVIFPDDTAALKAVYVSINIIEKKWTNQLRHWPIILNRIKIQCTLKSILHKIIYTPYTPKSYCTQTCLLFQNLVFLIQS